MSTLYPVKAAFSNASISFSPFLMYIRHEKRGKNVRVPYLGRKMPHWSCIGAIFCVIIWQQFSIISHALQTASIHYVQVVTVSKKCRKGNGCALNATWLPTATQMVNWNVTDLRQMVLVILKPVVNCARSATERWRELNKRVRHRLFLGICGQLLTGESEWWPVCQHSQQSVTGFLYLSNALCLSH